MAKATAGKQPVTTNPFTPSYDLPKLPEGFKERSGELVGYWDPDMTYIHFIPEKVNLFDNKIQNDRVSAIIIGTLCRDMPLAGKEEGEIVEGKKGDSVGVWYSPGMRGIIDLEGVEVIMYPNGVKQTGKPNDMKVYSVQSAKKGGRLEPSEDFRQNSRHQTTPFDPKGTRKQGPAAGKETADDTAPF